MNLAGIPTKFPIAWGAAAGGGMIRPIPTVSQIGVNAGYASFPDGFVPLNATPTGAGGIPPFVQDMNGILNEISLWSQWQQAGGPVTYDLAFATAVGGYPRGAVLTSNADSNKFWINQLDGNATDPDGGGAAHWANLFAPIFANAHFTGASFTVDAPATFNSTVNLGANGTATTQATGDSDTSVATTQFVHAVADAGDAAVEAYVSANYALLSSFGFGGNVTDGAHLEGLQIRWGRFTTAANPHTEPYSAPFGSYSLMQVACVEDGGVGSFTVLVDAQTDPAGITVRTRLNGVDSTGITVHYIAFGY